eukprot:4457144-Prymnesium_polylepis.1
MLEAPAGSIAQRPEPPPPLCHAIPVGRVQEQYSFDAARQRWARPNAAAAQERSGECGRHAMTYVPLQSAVQRTSDSPKTV